jgi:hypothetical protein
LALDREDEEGEHVVSKRAAKATKRSKRVKDLAVTKAEAQKTKGGTGGTFEIKDWSFGANPMNLGASTGQGSAPSIGEIKPKGK